MDDLKISKTKVEEAYKVLGVTRSWNVEKIKQQYKKLALQLHPDRDTGSEHLFILVKESYIVVLQDLLKSKQDKQFIDLKKDSLKSSKHKEIPDPVRLPKIKGDDVMKHFHKTFEETRIENENSRGYGKFMAPSAPPDEKIDIERRFNKFTSDSFNKEFNKDNVVNTEHFIAKYNPEPFACAKSLHFTELGVDKIEDFSGKNESRKDLHYTDYLKAYTTTKLTNGDVDEAQFKKKTINDIEKERSNISFEMNEHERRKYYDYKEQERKKEERRLREMEKQDFKIQDMFEKRNQMLLSFKS